MGRIRYVRMKRMVHKITRVIIAIAICGFLAYGVDTAAGHCCSAITSICSPSGVRSPQRPLRDVHCQTAPGCHLNPHRSAEEGGGSIWHEFSEPTTCCTALPCTPIRFTARPGPSPPPLPWLHESGNSFTSDSDHNAIAFSRIDHARNHPTTPIFLLTKSIIC